MNLWSNTARNADNLEFKCHDADAGEGWDFSGHYSNVKFFDVSRTMYGERQMLGQHGDNSGTRPPEPLEIIHRQHLENN